MTLTSEQIAESTYSKTCKEGCVCCANGWPLYRRDQPPFMHFRKEGDLVVEVRPCTAPSKDEVIEALRQRAEAAEAKLAGIKQEWRVTFKYANGEEDFFPGTDVEHCRPGLERSGCSDFRLQSRYAPTDWKDVEPA